MTRVFPHPLLSVTLLALWLLLNNSVSAGHIVLGSILALCIPWLTVRLNPPRQTIRRPMLALRYLLVLLWDILVSNVLVAIQVLGPTHKLQPAFIAVPLELTAELPITVLASSISLTPGTVSVDVSKDRRWLYVHVLSMDDEEETIAGIKDRYERPLKEIFG